MDKLNDLFQEIAASSLVGLKEDVPQWSKESDAMTCSDESCFYVGTKIPTSFPSKIYTCPVCGVTDN